MSQKLLILTKDMYTKYWYLLCIISVIRINIKYIFITNLIGDLNVDNIFYKISQLKLPRLWFTFFLDGVSTIIVDGVLDVHHPSRTSTSCFGAVLRSSEDTFFCRLPFLWCIWLWCTCMIMLENRISDKLELYVCLFRVIQQKFDFIYISCLQ